MQMLIIIDIILFNFISSGIHHHSTQDSFCSAFALGPKREIYETSLKISDRNYIISRSMVVAMHLHLLHTDMSIPYIA
jgi:hypothetical protein